MASVTGMAAAGLRLSLVAAAPSPGVEPVAAAAVQPQGLEQINTAKALMLTGRTDEAKLLLQQLARSYSNNNDIDFLLGMLALDDEDYDRAIRHFRAILARHPGAVRVRLELARAFFLDGDYENAFRNFQLARAGQLPPGVGATIDRFLSVIRQQKNWSYNVSMAVAPDTNINNGTSAREANLFGLPFELSDDSRKRSGIGISFEAAAEFAPRISEKARFRMGAALQRREYKASDFDDMTLAVHFGPRLVHNKWDLSFTGTAFQRRFGTRRLNEGIGARIEATHHLDARTAISFGSAAQQIRYPHAEFHDGRAFSLWGGAIRALTPESFLTARIGASRKEAKSDDLAFWSYSASVSYYRDLPAGFSIYAEPSYSEWRYDAPDGFFGARRGDRLLELRLALLNRLIVLDRFTPRIGLVLARRESNIELYDYTQRRIEIGVTSTF